MDDLNGIFRIRETVAGNVIHDNKVVSTGSKKERIVYQNPINHSLLNFAVLTHKPSSILSKKYIAIDLKLIDGESKKVWINIASLAKRLGISKSEILEKKDSPQFASYLHDKITEKSKQIETDFKARASTVKIKTNLSKTKIESAKTKLRALLSDLAWHVTMGVIRIPQLRRLLKSSSKGLENLSKARAVREFHRAKKSVPAYKKFLEEKGLKNISRFNQVPQSDKESYIKPNNVEDTLMRGKIPNGAQIDTSTGTTGKPAVWVRSTQERALNKKIVNILRDELICDAKFINAYALGGFSTGLTTHTYLVDEAAITSVGTDCAKVLDMIQILGKDGSKVVITGYPSFMSTLKDYAKEQGVNLKDYNLAAIVGGEPISEKLRDRLMLDGDFKQVLSGYGASDLDVNIGFENDFCISLRKECLKNPQLAKDLFGDKQGSPMIFQYNPLLYYIETDENSNLIYTSTSGEKLSPRIRYNSHDVGMTMTKDELKKVLKMYNIDFEIPDQALPFLFVWGREDSAASHNSAKVVPHELEKAISSIDELKDLVENFGLHNYEDDNGELKLDFWIELKKDADPGLSTEEIKGKILDYIGENSVDFKRMDALAKERPGLKIFSYQNSPMNQGEQPSHIKKKYVYKGEFETHPIDQA